MKSLTYGILAGLLVVGCGSATISSSGISGSPEDAVKAFAKAVASQDGNAVKSLVFSNSLPPDGDFLKGANTSVEVSDLKVKMIEPYLAEVSLKAKVAGTMFGASSGEPVDDTVTLIYAGGSWKLLPVLSGNMRQPGLSTVAMSMAMYPVFQQAKGAAQDTSNLSNVKQISLGMIMYSGDYDEMLFPKEGEPQKLLAPYLKNDKLWTAAGEPDGTKSFSFNDRLRGRSMTSIPDPSKVVMFYQGHDGKLSFSKNGKAAVGFCDGHAKNFTPETESSLVWDPDAK